MSGFISFTNFLTLKNAVKYPILLIALLFFILSTSKSKLYTNEFSILPLFKDLALSQRTSEPT